MKKNSRNNKKISKLFTISALILSHLMCIVVAYDYRDMLCGIAHSCYSAPAEAAFFAIIPFAIGILLCAALAWVFGRKAN
ncbi:MAG: hypothetical protein IJ325_06030 [Clostridia bacterium]|nr:hypothetical protein [Clostridia bacterium]